MTSVIDPARMCNLQGHEMPVANCLRSITIVPGQ